jgi:hypothetical protein
MSSNFALRGGLLLFGETKGPNVRHKNYYNRVIPMLDGLPSHGTSQRVARCYGAGQFIAT